MCAKSSVTYLIYTSQHSDVTHSGLWTATSLDVNVFMYVVVLLFRWFYINEYCKCCFIATAMKLYTNNFIEYIYILQGDVKLLLVTVNNRFKFEIEIVHDLSCHPIALQW